MDVAKEETGSQAASCNSRATTSSGSTATKARARAEAARVRALYAQKEAKLRLEQAEREARQAMETAHNVLEKTRVEVELQTLAVEREAAAASAQAEVLEEAEGDERSHHSKHSKRSSNKELFDRTSVYVKQQNELKSELISCTDRSTAHNQRDVSVITWGTAYEGSEDERSPNVTKPVKMPEDPAPDFASSKTRPHANKTYQEDIKPEIKFLNPNQTYQEDIKPDAKPQASTSKFLNPSAQSYTPLHYPTPPDPGKTPGMTDFVKYLARRELVTTGLNQFDDQPESFRAWQSSFLNAIRGLDLSHSEELDLLTKWLGKESSNHVRRMRQVHVNNPEAALRKAWDRLSECYASPEVIENALFKKLDSFPNISSKDHNKLRELGDLLMEIQSAKEDGYLPGLSYLDNARGISPILEKLPHGLQEKWIYQGSRFKDEHNGIFPPFAFFTNFICYEARTRNDPSFALPSNNNPPTSDKPVYRSGKIPVSVYKTDISTDTEPDTDSSPTQDENPGKNCPIHNKPHPLRRCHEFRAKTLDERKAFLREHGICYKCCSSISHLAKNCKASITCSECESDRHIAAMHPGPALQAPTTTPQHNEEEGDHSSSPTVTSHCTVICGNGQPAMSCSKICLVRVFPQGQRDKAITMYTVLDDQSNCSLARPEFFELFDVKSQSSPYSLSTCAGVVKTSGRKAEGFQIEPVNGGDTLALPPLIECSQIPSKRSEIPTPKAALSHPHLRSVAGHIPEIDPNAQILLLLGRDIVRVHKVRQQVNGPDNAPFAQRLDLGWVVVGEVCLGNAHKPNVINFKTRMLESGHASYLTPCNSFMDLKKKSCHGGEQSSTHKSKEKATEHNRADLASRDVSASHVVPNERSQAMDIVKPVQMEAFPAELSALTDGESLHKSSPVFKLNPVLQEGLLIIGGKLKHAPLEHAEKDPLLKRHVSTALMRHHHKLIKHRGRKWIKDHRNLKEGDVVLLKDSEAARNQWPIALVTSTFPSQDGNVRKVEVKTTAQGSSKTFLRPVTEVVLLPEEEVVNV